LFYFDWIGGQGQGAVQKARRQDGSPKKRLPIRFSCATFFVAVTAYLATGCQGWRSFWNPEPHLTNCITLHGGKMPVISITMGQGQATKTQKEAIIESFTESAMEILKLPAPTFTILIHELSRDSIGVGGSSLEAHLKVQQED
jgi:4-oxalocrotonate tautomerase